MVKYRPDLLIKVFLEVLLLPLLREASLSLLPLIISLHLILCCLSPPPPVDNTTNPSNSAAPVGNCVFVPAGQSERFVSCMVESCHNPSLARVASMVSIGAKC